MVDLNAFIMSSRPILHVVMILHVNSNKMPGRLRWWLPSVNKSVIRRSLAEVAIRSYKDNQVGILRIEKVTPLFSWRVWCCHIVKIRKLAIWKLEQFGN